MTGRAGIEGGVMFTIQARFTIHGYVSIRQDKVSTFRVSKPQYSSLPQSFNIACVFFFTRG